MFIGLVEGGVFSPPLMHAFQIFIFFIFNLEGFFEELSNYLYI